MAKKGRLSADEKKYILDHQADAPEKIAKKLDRSLDVVLALINASKPQAETSVTGVGVIRNDKVIGAVMTEQLSEKGDDHNVSERATRYNAAIFKRSDKPN